MEEKISDDIRAAAALKEKLLMEDGGELVPMREVVEMVRKIVNEIDRVLDEVRNERGGTKT